MEQHLQKALLPLSLYLQMPHWRYGCYGSYRRDRRNGPYWRHRRDRRDGCNRCNRCYRCDRRDGNYRRYGCDGCYRCHRPDWRMPVPLPAFRRTDSKRGNGVFYRRRSYGLDDHNAS